MKQYKGWEIAKMICEGKLKDGDTIQNEMNIKFKISDESLIFDGDFGTNRKGHEAFSSWLSNKSSLFKIIQQPVSFVEAIKAYSTGKNIRCEYEGNSCFYNTGITLVDSKGRPILTREILGGKWYIEESED